MAELEGKVVLITGAGKGTGRALAQLFAAWGARVAANDISPVNLDDLVEGNKNRIRAYPEDVAKKVGAQAVVKQVEDDYGGLDILINYAAVEPHIPLLDMDEWDWHRVLDVNLTGAFLVMQSAGRVMRQNGSGVIINWVGLDDPLRGSAGAYAASMHGLIALTLAASEELASHGVFVHAAGRGIRRFQHAEPSTPTDLSGAIFSLCRSSRSGQIVNVERL